MEDAKDKKWVDDQLIKHFDDDGYNLVYEEQVVELKSKEEVIKFAEGEFKTFYSMQKKIHDGGWEGNEEIAARERIQNRVHRLERCKRGIRKKFIDYILQLWKEQVEASASS